MVYASQIPEKVPFPTDPSSQPRVVHFAERFLTRMTPGEGTGYDGDTLANSLAAEMERLRGHVHAPGVQHLTQFILKTVTDCNLRCRYPCYEYVDDDWQRRPAVMSDEVAVGTARRIGEYAATNSLSEVDIVFHGGEPLYMKQPEKYYDRIVPLLTDHIQAVAPDTNITFGMQTNAVLLRKPILDVLRDQHVALGISLDGDAAAHDTYRLTRNGRRGSHELVMRGLALVSSPEYASLVRSILCVVNIDADPLAVDTFLREHAPPSVQYIDYLLPYATHDNPPRQPKDPARQSDTPYADWLLPIYWRSLRQSSGPGVRLFNSIMQLILGGRSSTEAIGPEAGSEVIVRTDGSYELVDSLKVTAEGAVATNMNIETHGLDAVATLLRQSGQLGEKTIASACQACPVLATCGGGHIATRYSTERLFDNASVYCADLKVLVSEITRATNYHTRRAMASVLRQRGVSADRTATHECNY